MLQNLGMSWSFIFEMFSKLLWVCQTGTMMFTKGRWDQLGSDLSILVNLWFTKSTSNGMTFVWNTFHLIREFIVLTKAFYLCLSMWICFMLWVFFFYIWNNVFLIESCVFPLCEDYVHFSFVHLYDLYYKNIVWSMLSWKRHMMDVMSVFQVCHW